MSMRGLCSSSSCSSLTLLAADVELLSTTDVIRPYSLIRRLRREEKLNNGNKERNVVSMMFLVDGT